jgi:hypothetical protein
MPCWLNFDKMAREHIQAAEFFCALCPQLFNADWRKNRGSREPGGTITISFCQTDMQKEIDQE